MKIETLPGDIRISGTEDFDLAKIFGCGQCFRWEPDDEGGYTGVAFGRAAYLREENGNIFISGDIDDFNNLWRSYFDIDCDYEKVRRHIGITDFMHNATRYGKGIRILRQQPWETLCSFLISQNNNINRIKKIINTLCREFGNPVICKNKTLYSFPAAETLCRLSENDLSVLRCGYRAKYIISAAKAVSGGDIDLGSLKESTPDKAFAILTGLPGAGSKVANCVMLFAFHMTDAFPVDVWMKRALAQHFAPGFDPSVFSPYAGIAQQYIFHYMRNAANI